MSTFLVAVGVAPTHAEPPGSVDQKALAEQTFREGMKAFVAGDYAEACPKLEAADRLVAGEALGGRLNLAHCYEKLGRHARAWALFIEVAARAHAAAQFDRETSAKDGAKESEARLHRIRLVVPDEVRALAGLEVRLGGITVPAALYGDAMPVDPGAIAVEVRAEGRAPSVESMVVPDAAGTTSVTLRAPAAPVVREPPAAPPAAPPREPRPSSLGVESHVIRSPALATASDLGGRGVAGIVVAGAGVVGFGAGVALGVHAKSNYDRAYVDEHCASANGVITCDHAASFHAARSLADAGTGTAVAGGALTAIGLALLVSDRLAHRKQPFTMGPQAAPNPARAWPAQFARLVRIERTGIFIAVGGDL